VIRRSVGFYVMTFTPWFRPNGILRGYIHYLDYFKTIWSLSAPGDRWPSWKRHKLLRGLPRTSFRNIRARDSTERRSRFALISSFPEILIETGAGLMRKQKSLRMERLLSLHKRFPLFSYER